MSWFPIDSGTTIGDRGSENGVIVEDDEHSSGARITLERSGSIAPWSVTCGIYGAFMHTAFAASETEGRSKYSAMKIDLERILVEEDSDAHYELMKRFADTY